MKKMVIGALLFILISITVIFMIYSYLFSPLYQSPDYPNQDLPKFASHEKKIKIEINNDGTSKENIRWTIRVNDRLSYFPISDWGLFIPKTASDILVSDKSGEINSKIEEQPGQYNLLSFQNSEEIKHNSEYFFDISYNVEKNPIFLKPFAIYERTFTRFKTDDKFDLEVSIPNEAKIRSVDPTPIGKNPMNFKLEKEKSQKIKLELEFPGLKEKPIKINSKYYSMTLPKRYANEYTSVLDIADAGYLQLEDLYGFSQSNEKISIEIINLDDADFEENVGAFYLGGGRIRMKITNLQKTESDLLNIILHETVHVFNSEYFSDSSSNNWLEEGTASFYSEYILENLGYDLSTQKSQNSEILSQCKNIEKTFISSWRPNLYLREGESQEINCDGIMLSPVSLGYAQSYSIISTLTETYGIDVMKKFFMVANKEQTQFSSSHSDLNKQINQVLSKATNKDTTPLLTSLGIEIDGTDNSNPITGFQVLGDKDKEKKTYLFVLLLIVLIALVILTIKATKNVKRINSIKNFKHSPYYKFEE